MRKRWSLCAVATFATVMVSCAVWEPPNRAPNFDIQYPIRHYFVSDETLDFAQWKEEVRVFRARLRRTYMNEGAPATPVTPRRERDFIDRAVDPRLLIAQDPRYFFKTPLLLSWWEVVDENGRVVTVYVIASNQSRPVDRRVLAWCVNDMLWQPAQFRGSATASIRSASINFGESKYHISYWEKRFSEYWLIILALAVITVSVLWVRHKTKIRDAEKRRAAAKRIFKHWRPTASPGEIYLHDEAPPPEKAGDAAEPSPATDKAKPPG